MNEEYLLAAIRTVLAESNIAQAADLRKRVEARRNYLRDNAEVLWAQIFALEASASQLIASVKEDLTA